MNPVRRARPRPLGTLAYAAAWLVPWRAIYRSRAARSKLAFYAHRADAIGRHIAKYGTHEPLVTRWMDEFLNAAPRGIVVDVGANLGWHALHAARHPNVETVVAFEPDPFNASLLKRNAAANNIGNIIIDPRAVGAAAGQALLHRYRSSNFGRHSLASDHGHGSVSVPVIDLDSALATYGHAERPVTLIKIDVEGYEAAVIAGARNALSRADAVVLEYSPAMSRAAGLPPEDMLAKLQSARLTPYVLLAAGGTTPATFDELKGFDGTLDVILVRAARLPQLGRGMNEQPRTVRTLIGIAEENKQIKQTV